MMNVNKKELKEQETLQLELEPIPAAERSNKPKFPMYMDRISWTKGGLKKIALVRINNEEELKAFKAYDPTNKPKVSTKTNTDNSF